MWLLLRAWSRKETLASPKPQALSYSCHLGKGYTQDGGDLIPGSQWLTRRLTAQGTSLQRTVALSFRGQWYCYQLTSDPNLESLSAEIKVAMALEHPLRRLRAGRALLPQGAWVYLASTAESESHVKLLSRNTGFQPGEPQNKASLQQVFIDAHGTELCPSQAHHRSRRMQAAAAIPEQGSWQGFAQP